MTSDEVRQRIARAHAELQAIADEHVDLGKGMGQDIAVTDLNALRGGAEAAWDEEPLLHADWQTTYQGSRSTPSCAPRSPWVSSSAGGPRNPTSR